jgi:hypothetical protein
MATISSLTSTPAVFVVSVDETRKTPLDQESFPVSRKNNAIAAQDASAAAARFAPGICAVLD